MRKITLPDWVKKLPNDAQLTSREILPLFGYEPTEANIKEVRNRIARCLLPEPSVKSKGFSQPGRLRWTVADLKKYERECKIVVDK